MLFIFSLSNLFIVLFSSFLLSMELIDCFIELHLNLSTGFLGIPICISFLKNRYSRDDNEYPQLYTNYGSPKFSPLIL